MGSGTGERVLQERYKRVLQERYKSSWFFSIPLRACALEHNTGGTFADLFRRSDSLATCALTPACRYYARVAAYDAAQQTSEKLQSDPFTVDRTAPAVATNASKLCARATSAGLVLDWAGVFSEDTCKATASKCLRFEVSVGTALGATDILHRSTTETTAHTLKLADLPKTPVRPAPIFNTTCPSALACRIFDFDTESMGGGERGWLRCRAGSNRELLLQRLTLHPCATTCAAFASPAVCVCSRAVQTPKQRMQ